MDMLRSACSDGTSTRSTVAEVKQELLLWPDDVGTRRDLHSGNRVRRIRNLHRLSEGARNRCDSLVHVRYHHSSTTSDETTTARPASNTHSRLLRRAPKSRHDEQQCECQEYREDLRRSLDEHEARRQRDTYAEKNINVDDTTADGHSQSYSRRTRADACRSRARHVRRPRLKVPLATISYLIDSGLRSGVS